MTNNSKLENLISANKLSKGIDATNLKDFVLKNPQKISTELLPLVANHLFFYKKLEKKIPDWFENLNLLAPAKISIEQCSSQFTANFKASIINGKNGVDLCGGLGVDSFFISKNFENFIYIEPNEKLFETVKYNFTQLNNTNTEFINKTAEEFLNSNSQKFDCIFLDPSRRDEQNNKKFKIDDCSPNLLVIKDSLLVKSSKILVKYSPLLDLKNAIEQLQNIHKIFILAEKNEVKEVLFLLRNSNDFIPQIVCINQTSTNYVQEFEFNFSEEQNNVSNFSDPKQYLFEPNAAILKAGGFKTVGHKFNLCKLSANSHLYTSDDTIKNFPGRCFKIIQICSFDKKEIQKHLPFKKANITCRNFPVTPDVIKKKIGITEGGDSYLFFTQIKNQTKIVIICEKLT